MAILKAQTKFGAVRGRPGHNIGIGVFRGIPYAAPPVGELRYAPPQDPEPWEGERFCADFSPVCVQQVRFNGMVRDPENQSEDCLYLNVWTPAKSRDEKLPVMFWIHGGANNHGSGGDSAGSGTGGNGENLAARGVVVVTINYRLNMFGFLNLKEIESRSGLGKCVNNAYLDQQKALRWVRDNIAQFGGDPDNITIFGQSAGGNATRAQLVSPLAKGLFRRAIPQSGGGARSGRITESYESARENCTKVFEKSGLTADDLLNGDAKEIYAAMVKASIELSGNENSMMFSQPFVDGYTVLGDIGDEIALGHYDADVICGHVEGDAGMFGRNIASGLPEEFSRKAHRAFAFCSTLVWARMRANDRPIYTYYMDRSQPQRIGTPHGSDISYTFGNLAPKKVVWDEFDILMSETIMDYWTNFAKTGDPNGEGLPVWHRYTPETPYAMDFGETEIAERDLIENETEERLIAFLEKHTGPITAADIESIKE